MLGWCYQMGEIQSLCRCRGENSTRMYWPVFCDKLA